MFANLNGSTKRMEELLEALNVNVGDVTVDNTPVVDAINNLTSVMEFLLQKEVHEIEIVRLKHDVSGTAVAGKTDADMTVGNVFTLTGEYDGFLAHWPRETEQDDRFTVNGFGYKAGVGNITHSVIPGLQTSWKECYDQELEFEVLQGYLEIVIARKK